MRTLGLALILMPSAALAGDGVQIPEPSNLTLFAIGVAGLIIGRQAAKRSRKSGEE